MRKIINAVIILSVALLACNSERAENKNCLCGSPKEKVTYPLYTTHEDRVYLDSVRKAHEDLRRRGDR